MTGTFRKPSQYAVAPKVYSDELHISSCEYTGNGFSTTNASASSASSVLLEIKHTSILYFINLKNN